MYDMLMLAGLSIVTVWVVVAICTLAVLLIKANEEKENLVNELELCHDEKSALRKKLAKAEGKLSHLNELFQDAL